MWKKKLQIHHEEICQRVTGEKFYGKIRDNCLNGLTEKLFLKFPQNTEHFFHALRTHWDRFCFLVNLFGICLKFSLGILTNTPEPQFTKSFFYANSIDVAFWGSKFKNVVQYSTLIHILIWRVRIYAITKYHQYKTSYDCRYSGLYSMESLEVNTQYNTSFTNVDSYGLSPIY